MNPASNLSMSEYPALWSYLRSLPEGERLSCLRLMARTDLYFLLRYLLNRPDVERQWIFERIRMVQNDPDGYLDLWARDHYKSTVITYAKTIQDILASHGQEPLEVWQGRELTCCILSHKADIAKSFLVQIKNELETNQGLKDLFPDVLYQEPQRESPKWNESEIVVRRNGNPKEATVEAHGLVDGQPTGKHFMLLLYDDVVTDKSVGTAEQINKTTSAFELSDNLGTQGMHKVRVVGTRYHFADTYSVMEKRGAVIPRVFPATDDGKETGTPVLLTQEALDTKRRKQGRYTFACQMLLNPIASGLQGFSRDWERFYAEVNWNRQNRVLLVDPSSGKKKNSDRTAMVVIGLGEDRNYYILDIVRDRLNLKQRAQMLFRLHRKWRPRVVGYESYGLQADIEYIQGCMADESYRFEIKELGGSVKKEDRVMRLAPIMEDGRLYWPISRSYTDVEGKTHDLVETVLNEEVRPYPAVTFDDTIDAIARIFDVECPWPKPLPHEVQTDRYSRQKRSRGSWMSA